MNEHLVRCLPSANYDDITTRIFPRSLSLSLHYKRSIRSVPSNNPIATTASLADTPLHAYALLLTQIVCKRCVGKVTASQAAGQASLSAVRRSSSRCLAASPGIAHPWRRDRPCRVQERYLENGNARNREKSRMCISWLRLTSGSPRQMRARLYSFSRLIVIFLLITRSKILFWFLNKTMTIHTPIYLRSGKIEMKLKW